MVNKRFNKKFRRALGAALGALAVSSISNIETIGAAFTETSLAGNAQIGDIFKMSKGDKERIFNAIENDLIPQIKYGKSSSGILKDKNLGGPNLTHVSLSYPIKYAGFGHWDGAWNVTFKWNAHPSVRITIIKSDSSLDGGADYLIIPAVNDDEWKNRDEYNKYIRTHDVPWVGNWIHEGKNRPLAHAPYMRRFGWPPPAVVDVLQPSFFLRLLYAVAKRGFDAHHDPLPNPAGTPDATCLTRWDAEGLMDVSIWNKILGDDANVNAMYYDIDRCPTELQGFYYPPEKKESTTFISNSSPAPVINPTPTNMTPALTALEMIPAAMTFATNQSATTTPTNVVANNNVTPGSNSVGAAPATKNGSVSSGSTDVGSASQTVSDVKPTSVQHDAKSEAHSNEPLKT